MPTIAEMLNRDGNDGLMQAGNVRDDQPKSRSAAMFKLETREHWARMKSDEVVADVMPSHYEKGAAYHVLSMGDCDMLSFIAHAVRQQVTPYVLIATWSVGMDDVNRLARMVERGDIGRIDCYLTSMDIERREEAFKKMHDVCSMSGGRCVRMWTHAKCAVVFGDRCNCVIETSANLNMNPRIEQFVITVDDGLANFYKEFFDGLKTRGAEFREWRPWKGGDDGRY